MSYVRGNGQNGGHFYSNLTTPVQLACNFIVDSTNGNGLGIRSLKSNGYIQAVYMNTSATPAAGSPNPAAGLVYVKFNNNYNYYVGGFTGFVSPISGTPLASTTAGLAYTIVSLGTTTAAQWLAAGVPAGVTPAVGLSFVAIATGAIGGTGAVEVPATAGSGITNIEGIGNTRLSVNSAIGANGGMYFIGRFMASGVQTAPANESTVGMTFGFDASSVTIDGI